MRVVALAAVMALATGCATEDDSFEGEEYDVRLTFEEPIDQFVWWQGDWCPQCDPPLTPQMIADGTPVDAAGHLNLGNAQVVTFAEPTGDFEVSNAHPFGLDVRVLLLLGYRRDGATFTLISAATQLVTFNHGRFHTTTHVTSELLPDLELWGKGKRCAAVRGDFFVDETDEDCDGIAKAQDCNDGIYCTDSTAKTGCKITDCAP